MTDLAALNAMDAASLASALSGPPDAVVALLRIAAEGGAVEAQLRLGQALLDGTGVARTPAEALEWFGRAAQAGHAMGMNMVGRCIELGWGTHADPAAAAAWYRAAAEQGLDWGMYNLATLLALGRGVACDRQQALAWFRRAAARGHMKSITMVGSFHEDGWATPRDRAAAATCYARAAEAGEFRAMFNYARLLIEDGAVAAGLAWLARVPDQATDRFMAQVCAWAAAHEDDRVRAFALDAAC